MSHCGLDDDDSGENVVDYHQLMVWPEERVTDCKNKCPATFIVFETENWPNRDITYTKQKKLKTSICLEIRHMAIQN